MSIVVVKKESKFITIGCDTQETLGEDGKQNVFGCKLKKISDDFYVAGAGNAHMLSMFSSYVEKFTFPKSNLKYDIIEYFHDYHIWIKEKVDGFLEDQSQIINNQFLIINNGRVWEFSNFYIREILDGEFGAIGSGAPQALACSEITTDIPTILNAVCKHNIYCSEPIQIYTIKINTNE